MEVSAPELQGPRISRRMLLQRAAAEFEKLHGNDPEMHQIARDALKVWREYMERHRQSQAMWHADAAMMIINN